MNKMFKHIGLIALFCALTLSAFSIELHCPNATKDGANKLPDIHAAIFSRPLAENQSPMLYWTQVPIGLTKVVVDMHVLGVNLTLPPSWSSESTNSEVELEREGFVLHEWQIIYDPANAIDVSSSYAAFEGGQGIPAQFYTVLGTPIPSDVSTITEVGRLVLPELTTTTGTLISFKHKVIEIDTVDNYPSVSAPWLTTKVKLQYFDDSAPKEKDHIWVDVPGIPEQTISDSIDYIDPANTNATLADAVTPAFDISAVPAGFNKIAIVTTIEKVGITLPAGTTPTELAFFVRDYTDNKSTYYIDDLKIESGAAVFHSTENTDSHNWSYTVINGDEYIAEADTSGNCGEFSPLFSTDYFGPDLRGNSTGLNVRFTLNAYSGASIVESATFTTFHSSSEQVDILEPQLTEHDAPFPGYDRFQFKFTPDESGNAFYVVLPVSENAPVDVQVIAGMNSNYQFVTTPTYGYEGRGSLAVTGEQESSFVVDVPSLAGGYEVFVAIMDSSGNIKLMSNRKLKVFCPSAQNNILISKYGSPLPTSLSSSKNVSPMFTWAGVPRATEWLELTMTDKTSGSMLHWHVRIGSPFNVDYLPEDLNSSATAIRSFINANDVVFKMTAKGGVTKNNLFLAPKNVTSTADPSQQPVKWSNDASDRIPALPQPPDNWPESWNMPYTGPWPTIPENHHYLFTLTSYKTGDDGKPEVLDTDVIELEYTARFNNDTSATAVVRVETTDPLTSVNNTFGFTSHESGVAYYIVLPYSDIIDGGNQVINANVPTSQQIASGRDAHFSEVELSGSVEIEEIVPVTLTFDQLTAGNDYIIFVTIIDASGNRRVITNHAVSVIVEFVDSAGAPIAADNAQGFADAIQGKVVYTKVSLDREPITAPQATTPLPAPETPFVIKTLINNYVTVLDSVADIGLSFDPKVAGGMLSKDFTVVPLMVPMPGFDADGSNVQLEFAVSEGYSYLKVDQRAIKLAVEEIATPLGATLINLQKGWNLIGCPYIDIIPDNSFPMASIGGIWYHDEQPAEEFDVNVVVDSSKMMPGYILKPQPRYPGFWIYVQDHLADPNIFLMGTWGPTDVLPVLPGISKPRYRDWVLRSVVAKYPVGLVEHRLGSAWYWDQYTQTYKALPEDGYLEPGKAYWMFTIR